MKVTIKRFPSDEKETFGECFVLKDGEQVFHCFTLELPEKNNAAQVSCIPVGKYKCVYTNSIHLSEVAGHPVSTYQLLNVPGRAGIRIHSASYFSDLRGCVSFGYIKSDLNGDGVEDLAQSRLAVHDFEKLMNYEQFEIEIIYQENVS